MFGSVRFFPLPNQFKLKIISGFFHCSYFFEDFIFVLFLISQICAFCAYFLRNLGFLNKYDSFLTGWVCMISRNLIPIFFLLDLCPRIKLSKKIHKTKGKKSSNLTGEKKTKKRSKDICY
jgi:hypothetical protein